MSSGRWVAFVVSLVALACGAEPGFGQAGPPPDVWVVNRSSASLSIIDTTINQVVDTLDVADPDADGTVEPPSGIAFSTIPGQGGGHAFVTQQELVTVIDVATGRLVAVHDLSDDLAAPGLDLRGAAAARPRTLGDPSGPSVVKSYLHVAANVAGGASRFVVLDQELLLVRGSAPVVDHGALGEGTALDVTTLDNPLGEDALRAWYTLSTGSDYTATQVAAAGELGAPWRVTRSVTRSLPTSDHRAEALVPGAARDREFPVFPQASLGALENLDTGGTCTPGGSQVGAAVAGFGPNSYTVFSLDQATDEVVVIDARDCGQSRRRTGASPVDIALLGESAWTSAFIANHGDDTVTRLDEDGSVVSIPLGSSPGPCVDCPIALGVARLSGCDVENVTYGKADTDLDGSEDDIEIAWDTVGDCTDFEFVVGCDCLADDPLCPCYCDCDNDPLPECLCPGLLTLGDGPAAPVDGPLDALMADPWGTGGPIPWKKLGTTTDTSFSLTDYGDAEGSMALDVHAEPLFEASTEAAVAAKRRDLEGFARNNYAGLLVEQGRFGEAAEQLDRAGNALDEAGLEDAARGLPYNRAALLVQLGEAARARELLEDLHARATSTGDDWTADASALALGALHLAVDETGLARSWYASVSQADSAMAVRAEFGLGRVALDEERWEEARSRLERAAAEAVGEDPVLSLFARALLARAEIELGRHDAAAERLAAVVGEADAREAGEPAWLGRWLLGRLAMRQGRWREAIGHLTEATARVDAQRGKLDPLDEGLRFLRERFDPYVDLAVAHIRAESGDDTGGRVAARVHRVLDRAHALSLRRAWEGASPLPGRRELATVRSGLQPGELLVGYLLGERHGVVLAASRHDVRAAVIPGRSELLGALRPFRESLVRGLTGDAASGPFGEATTLEHDPHGQRLREMLIDPFADLLARGNRLYVVPDRELALLPFAALPVGSPEEGQSGTGSQTRYLGDHVEIAVMPLFAAPSRREHERVPVLLAGNPALDPESGYPPLPWSAYELDQLQAVWRDAGPDVLAGVELTGMHVTSLLHSRYGTVHLATHAEASTRDPRRCGIVLSRGERLGLADIAELDLSGALVVLSACRTGEGELVPGEGVIGLRWALLRAGADALVVSLWPVDDAASARLMVDFHRRLRAGEAPPRALAAARRALARDYPHPAHWAPFVVMLRPDL